MTEGVPIGSCWAADAPVEGAPKSAVPVAVDVAVGVVMVFEVERAALVRLGAMVTGSGQSGSRVEYVRV